MKSKPHNVIDRAPQRYFGRPFERLAPIERRVLELAETRSPIATDYNASMQPQATFGERLSDSIARVGGSWAFIIVFFAFLAAWVLINAVVLTQSAFDPYPFIFLNLVLSMVAAVQAPIIMMSQNRAAERDRRDAGQDYAVNLKAEIEILSLHEKLDDMRLTKIEHSIRLLENLGERLGRIEAQLVAGQRPDGSGHLVEGAS